MAVQHLIPLSVVLFSSAKALFFYLQYNVKNFFGELVGSVLSEKSKLINVGGTIEQALVGQYKINSKAVLSEAWSNTKKSRMSINLALLFVLVLGIIVSLVASSFFGGIELILQQAQVPEQKSQALQIINIIVTITIWPFIAGIEMIGVFHAVNKPIHPKMVWGFLNRGSWVALCALLTSILINIGVQLFVIPGIILAALSSLTIPLVVEKKYSPLQAIVTSLRSLRFSLLPLLVIYGFLLMTLLTLVLPMVFLLESNLLLLAILFFLFGLSYLAPLFYNVKGILYREIFGVLCELSGDDEGILEQKTSKNDFTDTDDSFSA
jgi:hypothetical protein